MRTQIIEKEGQPKWALIPYEEYLELLDAKEELEDIQDFDESIAHPPEKIPIEWVGRIINGEHPVRVWREYRGFTQQKLAQACNVTSSEISQIETGEYQVSQEVLQKMAKTLNMDVESL
ncbi:MAG: hypothetical protein B6247_16180 [Candidatus Parabeggiatoa sp. nov. 2]|nr:MAG: hypothetical protein B6247_16180 [Beggiatoa sp. 4572_84]